MSSVANSLLLDIINKIKDGITYVGVGTGTAPASTDTSLDSELSRKAAVELIDGYTIVKEGFWDETELNGTTITNAAAFYNGATVDAGSGQIAAGDAINITKDSTQSMTVCVELTLEGVGA